MTTELAKVYDPKAVEPAMYELWQKAGAFSADAVMGGVPGSGPRRGGANPRAGISARRFQPA